MLHVMWELPFDNGVPIVGFDLLVDGVEVSVPLEAVQQYVVAGLESGSARSFSVRATNSLGSGPFSQITTLATQPGPPKPPPPPLPPALPLR